MSTGKKKNRIMHMVIWALLVVTAVVLYITHQAVPFMMDDLWYSTMLSSEEPIRNFGDIIESQIWHYRNWGGRSLTHGMLQITLLAGESVTDVLNVVMTFLLGVVICQVADVRQKAIKPMALLVAVAMSIGLNANWKMSMFWQAGAANYLYITVFILVFLNCYLREVETLPENADVSGKHLPGISIWILPLGVLAGWSNENMGPAAWVITLAVMYLVKKEQKKIPLWMILGSAASLFGSIMVVAAPGNFVRSGQVVENEYGTLWKCFLRCYAEAKAALEYLYPVLILLAMMLLLAKAVLKIEIGKKNILLLICALLSWGAMILSPHYPDRATFGTMVLLICVIVSLGRKILNEREDLRGWFLGVTLLIWLHGMFYLGEFMAISWGWIK